MALAKNLRRRLRCWSASLMPKKRWHLLEERCEKGEPSWSYFPQLTNSVLGILDPESKLIINFFIGQRTLQDCRTFIKDLIGRIVSKPLFTSDELPHYQTALAEQFSCLETQPTTGKRGRLKKPRVVIDPELHYATVCKTRDNGKVVKVERNIIFGDPKVIDHIIEHRK